MSSLLSSLNNVLQSMLAHQKSIQVIEHNVANANTPGYHRQEVKLGTRPASPAPTLYHEISAGQIGQGVSAEMVKRFNLTFYDGRFRTQTALGKRWETTQQTLAHVESLLAENTSQGLINKLDAFWAGWQGVIDDPTNLALRSNLQQKASSLAVGLNRRAGDLLGIRKDLDQEIIQDIDEINEIADQLARLNGEIANITGMELQANDLLDERDRLLDQLAEYSDIRIGNQDSGQVMVSLGGHSLVFGTETFRLETAPDPGNSNLVDVIWEDGSDFRAVEGSLTAYLDDRDHSVPELIAGLDEVAAALISEVNALHQGGYGLDNSTGLDFFTGTDALSIGLSGDISDPRSIAAASAASSPGDSSLAGQIADLRHQELLSAGSATFTSYYADQVAGLARQIQEAGSESQNIDLVIQSLQSQRDRVSSVSLDQEAANLIKSQRAFEAAARMATAVDEMLDRIINGMGLVGR
jgi:flagellar hook-associated protein 1 FlgK